MPTQFDVYLNPLKNRSTYPLLVVLQSPFADLAKTRIVAPAIRGRPASPIGGVLTPCIVVNGEDFTLHPFQLAAMKSTDLRQWVANVAVARDQITTALDHLFHDNS